MNKETQILNWLAIGLSQPPNSLNESFYFDKKSHSFFSILMMDYLLLDECLNKAKNTTSSYSESTQNKLIAFIKRIENNDLKIISIPRYTYKERNVLLSQFLLTIEKSEERNRLESKYLNSESDTFTKKFTIDGEQITIEAWENFKDAHLYAKADSFLNLNNINIASTTLLEFDEVGGYTIDLRKDENGNTIQEKNEWWKFWK